MERWRRDGVWLVRFLKRLKRELLAMLAKARLNYDPRVLNLWYGLHGKRARSMGDIATELGMVTADVWAARRAQLRYLQGENGEAAFEKAVLTVAKETKRSLPG